MKISCTQENLNQGLAITAHITGKNNNLPILTNILFKINDKIISLAATNLEIGITTTIRGKVEADGEFTVDAKLLANYISLLPKERIDLELDGDSLRIQCAKQKTKIKTQAAADYPLIPQLKKENPHIINANSFREAITKVIIAAANSDLRPEISGVFLNFSGQQLILAATDSYRLAENKISVSQNSKDGQENKIIAPVKTLQEISRILSVLKENALEETDNLEIYITDNQIMFSYGGVDLVSRIIEAQYPEYQQIIPASYKTKIKFNTGDLIKAVKTSSLFAKSGVYDVKLDFSNPKEVVITSSSSQTGESTSIIEAEINGEGDYIVLNYHYLLDGLQNIGSDSVLMEVNDKNSMCILRPESDKDYFYLIMPIRQED